MCSNASWACLSMAMHNAFADGEVVEQFLLNISDINCDLK
jgi:hypothetical protein